MKKYTGLTQLEAKKLLQEYGLNTFTVKKEYSFLHAFLHQFIDPMMLLLIGAATLIFLIGDPSDAYLITGILFFNALVGTYQERKINHLIHTVEHQETQYALVVRDNREIIIRASDIVPGDYLIMQQGEQVHADAQILFAENLSINEAILSGEHIAVEKKFEDIIFKGSFISSGIVHAKVIATGNTTRVGKLNAIAQEISLQTPLQKDLSGVIHIILGAVITICISLLVIGFLTNRPFAELFAAITALFICVVPQGLPVIMTLILASSAFTLLKKHFFVKKMSAVDGLARSQVIIFDKTGTLTTNELSVNYIITSTGTYDITDKIDISVICNSLLHAIALLEQHHLAHDDSFSLQSNATDRALCALIQNSSINLTQLFNSTNLSPSSITIKDRNVILRSFVHNNEKTAYIMGAPENVIKYCTVNPTIQIEYERLLQKGCRIIAVAQKKLLHNDTMITNATLLGFIGLTENIRENISSTIAQLQNAGIKIMISTGDKKETALFVANKIGILNHPELAYDGSLLFETTKNDILKYELFYRMTPEKKIALIKTIQSQGFSVAMIGDGFNDAPAVAAADIGIALGIRSADVTKQAAAGLLLEEGFKNIIAIIGQGRHVFLSFKRVILYFFTTNFSEILIVIYVFCFKLPLPLLAPHILWLNLITDGFLDSSLALEPHAHNNLEKKWFERHNILIDKFLIGRIIYQSLIVTSIAAFLFTTHYKANLAHAQTLCLAAMTLCQCAMAINCRSFDKSLFSIGLFSNKTLALILVGITTGLTLITSTSWGNHTFKTVPLTLSEWIMLGTIAIGLIIAEELRKFVVRVIFK